MYSKMLCITQFSQINLVSYFFYDTFQPIIIFSKISNKIG